MVNLFLRWLSPPRNWAAIAIFIVSNGCTVEGGESPSTFADQQKGDSSGQCPSSMEALPPVNGDILTVGSSARGDLWAVTRVGEGRKMANPESKPGIHIYRYPRRYNPKRMERYHFYVGPSPEGQMAKTIQPDPDGEHVKLVFLQDTPLEQAAIEQSFLEPETAFKPVALRLMWFPQGVGYTVRLTEPGQNTVPSDKKSPRDLMGTVQPFALDAPTKNVEIRTQIGLPSEMRVKVTVTGVTAYAVQNNDDKTGDQAEYAAFFGAPASQINCDSQPDFYHFVMKKKRQGPTGGGVGQGKSIWEVVPFLATDSRSVLDLIPAPAEGKDYLWALTKEVGKQSNGYGEGSPGIARTDGTSEKTYYQKMDVNYKVKRGILMASPEPWLTSDALPPVTREMLASFENGHQFVFASDDPATRDYGVTKQILPQGSLAWRFTLSNTFNQRIMPYFRTQFVS